MRPSTDRALRKAEDLDRVAVEYWSQANPKEVMNMAKKGKGSKVRYRSAITGHFVKKATADRHPNTTVRETGK